MSKTSKISKIYPTGDSFASKDRSTGQPDGKTMHVFFVEFENGDKGKAYSLSNPHPAKVGDEKLYSITPKGGIRFEKAEGGSYGGGKGVDVQLQIIRQSSLKVAVEFEIGKMGKAAKLESIKSIADDLVAWVCRPKEELTKAEDDE